MTAAKGGLRSLAVLLTTDCNLRCQYCYRGGGTSRRLGWSACRAALDWAVGAAAAEWEIVFTGGEPLLAEPLLRRAVAHIETNWPAGRRPALILQTNGTLLGEAQLDYLAAHEIEAQVSCDGLPRAQRARGAGTWRPVSAALALALADERRRRKLAVAMTVTPANLRLLADSVAWLLELGVPRVHLSPCVTTRARRFAQWQAALDEQFDRLHELSLRHLRRTGTVPLSLFRWTGRPTAAPAGGWSVCAALAGTSAAVDVTGELARCSMFARSASPPRAAWRELPRLMSLGRPARRPLPGPLDAAELRGLDVSRRRSARGPCADCPVAAECRVCPFAGAIAGGAEADLGRVPDFQCAFHLAAQSWKRRFPPYADHPADAASPALLPLQMRAWQESVAAHRRAR